MFTARRRREIPAIVSGGGGTPTQVPVNLTPPTITRNGTRITVDPGDWGGNPTSFVVRHLRNGTAVPGATSLVWNAPPEVWGALFGCEVVGVNAAGQSMPALAQAVYIGILDVLSVQPLVAHYARRARAGYTGAALPKVRNDTNDPLTQDKSIPFTATGAIDEAALIAHCGTGNGSVGNYPNQMGDASYDAVNIVAATQPRIVNSGVVDRWNGAPTPIFVAASGDLLNVKSIDSGNVYVYAVLKASSATATSQTILGSALQTYLPIGVQNAQSNTNSFRVLGINDPPGLEMYLNGSQNPVPHNRGDAYAAITRDGGAVIKLGAVPMSPNAINLVGQSQAFALDGPVAGLFWFMSQLPAADETVLVQNQLATWAVPA